METLIYGGGAVGLSIASCLLRAGQEVIICVRKDTANLLRLEGLIRTGMFGTFSIKGGTLETVLSLDEVSNRKFDYILVSTKSFDSEPAAEDMTCTAVRTQIFVPLSPTYRSLPVSPFH